MALKKVHEVLDFVNQLVQSVLKLVLNSNLVSDLPRGSDGRGRLRQAPERAAARRQR